MNLGKKVDAYLNARQKANELEAKANEAKRRAEDIRSDLLSLMDSEGLEQAAGALGTAYLHEQTIYQLEDRDAFDRYVRRHNAFELYQARPAQKAIKDRVENSRGHKVPPGLKVFHKREIRVRARSVV